MASGPLFYQLYLCNWCSSTAFPSTGWGSGHTTPLNIASWDIEYLKLQFGKTADAEMLLCPSLLNQVINPHVRVPSLHLEERTILLSEESLTTRPC